MSAARRSDIVRAIVEQHWDSAEAAESIRAHLHEDYVHDTVTGSTDFEGFLTGLRWVDAHFAERTYRVRSLVEEEGRVAASVEWSAVRVEDGSAVSGRGAYFADFVDGRIVRDWDVFFPLS